MACAAPRRGFFVVSARAPLRAAFLLRGHDIRAPWHEEVRFFQRQPIRPPADNNTRATPWRARVVAATLLRAAQADFGFCDEAWCIICAQYACGARTGPSCAPMGELMRDKNGPERAQLLADGLGQ